jgi:hypothetical protein
LFFNSILNLINIGLGFLNLKVLFIFLDLKTLDNFFLIQSISLSISSVFIVSFEATFQNFIPKMSLKDGKILLTKSLILTSFFYLIFSIFNFKIFLFFPYAIFPIFLSYLYAIKKFTTSNIVNAFSIITTISLIFILKPKETTSVIFIYFLVYLIFCLFLIILIKPPLTFKKEIIFQIKDYYKLLFLSSLTSPIYRYLDRFILGFFGNVGDVSGFVLIRRIDNFIRQVLNAPLSIAVINISSNPNYFYEFFKKYLIFSFFLFISELILGYLLLIIIGGKIFLKFYFSLILFSFAFLISAIFSIFILKERVSNNPKPFLIFNTSFVIFYFILSIMLFKFFGYNGIALSFLISTIISNLIALSRRAL